MASTKLSPGQPIRFPAAEWNRHVDASDAYHGRKALGEGGSQRGAPLDKSIIKVKNIVGSDLARGSVVEVGAKIIDELAPDALWFEGKKPTRSDHRSFGILRQAMPQNAIDVAQVAGVVLARVNVANTAHRYAYVEKDQTVLKSAHAGNFILVAAATQTGTNEHAVIVGSQGASTRRLAKLTANLTKGGTAGITFLEYNSSGTLVATSDTDTVKDYWFNANDECKSGTKVIAEWFPPVWILAEMYCAVADSVP